MIKILVTGAGGGVGQGIIKSLKLIDDLALSIIAADMSPLAPGLYAADRAYLVPAARSDEYLQRLIEICSHEKIDYYFPGTDVELMFCAENGKRIEEVTGTRVVVCPSKVVKIADDKYLTFRFLKDNGFHAPNSWLPEDLDVGDVNYPVVVKPRVGCRSIGVQVVDSKERLISAINTTSDPLIQEFLSDENEEYTCTVVAVDGVASEAVVLRRVLRSGDTFRAEPIDNPGIASYVRDVAVALGVEGSCNFQLRLHEGLPKIFEINSRFSGTTPFCAQLGFNPVEYYLKLRLGMRYSYTINYEAMVLRHWTEIVVDKEKINEMLEKRSSKLKILSVSELFDRGS
jgi:carbamoyl-phosphate synthase large subunit